MDPVSLSNTYRRDGLIRSFDVLIGIKRIDWDSGVWRINCKSLIYWWAVQGSNLRPPD